MEKADGYYQDGALRIGPIMGNLDLLATIYLRLKSENLIERVFYEETPDLATFLRIMTAGNSYMLGSFSMDGEMATLTGYGWMEMVSIGGGYHKGTLQFGFFRQWQNGDWTRRSARLMIDWVFEKTMMDSVHGYTSVKNRAMVAFSKSLGYKQSILPHYSTWHGELCDVVISSMSKAQWRPTT